MKKIKGLFLLNDYDPSRFPLRGAKQVQDLHKDGQEVEIQYSSATTESDVIHSALIIGREEVAR